MHTTRLRLLLLFTGVLIAVLALLFWFPGLDILLAAIFFASSLGDEILDGLADKGRVSGIAGRLLMARPLLEISAFLASLFTIIRFHFIPNYCI